MDRLVNDTKNQLWDKINDFENSLEDTVNSVNDQVNHIQSQMDTMASNLKNQNQNQLERDNELDRDQRSSFTNDIGQNDFNKSHGKKDKFDQFHSSGKGNAQDKKSDN